jgi:hypothetical protein
MAEVKYRRLLELIQELMNEKGCDDKEKSASVLSAAEDYGDEAVDAINRFVSNFPA